MLSRPPRDVEHRADEHPVHVAQEHVRLDPELEQVAVLAPLGARRTSQWNQRVLGFAGREGGEVVLAGERVARTPRRASRSSGPVHQKARSRSKTLRVRRASTR